MTFIAKNGTQLSAQPSKTLLEHETPLPEKALSVVQDGVMKAVDISYDAAKRVQNVLAWEELPQWMQSDPYIRRGYRRQLDSFSACFQSLFYLHNETVNIWSHLLPTIIVLFALSATDYLILDSSVQLSAIDNAVIQTYVGGSVLCLLFSVCPHTQD